MICIIWLQISYRWWSCNKDSNKWCDVIFLSPASPPPLHSSSHNSYSFLPLVCDVIYVRPFSTAHYQNTPAEFTMHSHVAYVKVSSVYVEDCGLSAQISWSIHMLCKPNELSKCTGLWTARTDFTTLCKRRWSVQMCRIRNSYHRAHYAYTRCVIQASSVNVWDCGLFSAEFTLHAHAV